MLITNRQAIDNSKKLGKKALGEIRKKSLVKMKIKNSVYSDMLRNASFTVDQRAIYDKICKPYFDIRPEVLEPEIMEEKVPEL